MHTRRRRPCPPFVADVARVAAVAVALMVTTACGTAAVTAGSASAPSMPDAQASAGTSAAAGDLRQLEIRLYQFSEPDVTVAPGTTVRWRNNDQIVHTVTSGRRTYDDQGVVASTTLDGLFDFALDGREQTRADATYTFVDPGTYHVICTIHPGIDATIVVDS